MKQKIYITFDLDFADYLNDNNHFDELESTFDILKNILCKYTKIKTTWFIRLDSQIEKLYGSPDHFFNKHKEKISWLLTNGHSIGWHHHSYTLDEKNRWIQNTNEMMILEELKKYGTIARSKGLNICRMGWGYHTNKTMKLVSELGFIIDSSAIPRPNYKWDLAKKDWSISTCKWYYPSERDYRIEGQPSLKILEAPMTTTIISVESDTEPNVIRYLNPAYHEEIFQKTLKQTITFEKIVTVTHPYEFISNVKTHSLLSFNFKVFENNLKYIIDYLDADFETLR